MEIKICENCKKECKNLGVHQRYCNIKLPIQNNAEVETPKEEIKEPEQKSSIESRIDKMAEAINTLSSAVKILMEEKPIKKEEPQLSYSETQPNVSVAPEKFEKAGVIPPKFREIIDEVLSPDFGVELEYFDDTPNYTLHIFVPQKYSSVPKEHIAQGVKDVRSRVIPMAHGANGVRDWAMMVRKNLNSYFAKSGVSSPFSNK